MTICARDEVIRAKAAVTVAAGDAKARRPADSLGVVRAAVYIIKVHRVVHHRRTRRAPQERDELRAGAGGVRREVHRVRAGNDAALRRPENRVIVVRARGDIDEEVEHRVVVH